MRGLVYVLLGTIAVTTAISLLGPNVDLVVSRLFFDPTIRKFVADANPQLAALRENGLVAVATCIVLVVLGLMRLLPWRLPGIPPRNVVALTLSLIIGPGLLVNVILKPHGGRPRPAEVTQFGGDLRFVNWWSPNGACEGNCSFMSGEAATAAWMFGPAMLVPPPWRAVAIAAAATFTATISLLRVAGGGHFLSDVLIGALMTIVIILALNRWIAGDSGA